MTLKHNQKRVKHFIFKNLRPQRPRRNQKGITRPFNDDDLKFFVDTQGKINPKYINVEGNELLIIIRTKKISK